MNRILTLSAVTLTLAAPTGFAETSEAIRSTKTFLIEAHAGFNGIGVGLGLFLPNDSRIDINTSEHDAAYMFEGDSRTHRLEYQSFVANSFYYTIGLNQRFIRDYDLYYGFSGTYEIQAVHAHFSIGNEWSFRHFFIGGEWFGLSSPLSWKYTTHFSYSSEEDRQRQIKNIESLAQRTALIAPNLYIGFAF